MRTIEAEGPEAGAGDSACVVIKLGGSSLEDAGPRMREAVALAATGVRVVVVHGGGAAVSEVGARLGLLPRFEGGLRVTDEATMEVAQMVQVGLVARQLLTWIARWGGRGIGVSGQDGGGWLRAAPLDPARLGRVGRITSVDVDFLRSLPGIPVVSPVAVADDLEPLNVNADTVAAAVASALDADRLVFVTDVAGISGPEGPAEALEAAALERWIDEGVVHGGMTPKARACLDAVALGVRSVSVGRGLSGGTEVHP